jgi:hypothetical protein
MDGGSRNQAGHIGGATDELASMLCKTGYVTDIQRPCCIFSGLSRGGWMSRAERLDVDYGDVIKP